MTGDAHPQILILFAHPAVEKSRVNSRLVAAVKDLAGVTFNDLRTEKVPCRKGAM
jgi:glutathione-regulated potassium-efflux system ancillary protein KefG